MSVTKKRVTLQKLLANQQEIWVRNKVSSLGKGTGVLIISISPDSPDSVVVPPGNDPVCLTDQIDPESLRGCRDLFKLVTRGALELLDPEEADAYYAANVDRKEKLAQKMKKYLEKPQETAVVPKEVSMAKSDVTINAKLPGLCLRARKNSVSEADMFETLFENQSAFTPEDFGYLEANGHFASVKSWAKDQREGSKKDGSVEEQSNV